MGGGFGVELKKEKEDGFKILRLRSFFLFSSYITIAVHIVIVIVIVTDFDCD